ncbi:hypothetical protein GCM10009676_16510 [Prauserella halophila]|uniref:Uncharacterized protein n=1 Tax=Prauserella halophila TaxID=185641 RepID=A0ABN1W3H3_9PSEU
MILILSDSDERRFGRAAIRTSGDSDERRFGGFAVSAGTEICGIDGPQQKELLARWADCVESWTYDYEYGTRPHRVEIGEAGRNSRVR